MQDNKPLRFSEPQSKEKKTANTQPDFIRTKFWKRFTRTMAILIPLLLAPTIIVILLAIVIDPLYGWLLIPALIPLILAIVLLTISAVVGVIFLSTQHPTEREQAFIGIFVVFVLILLGFVLTVYPSF